MREQETFHQQTSSRRGNQPKRVVSEQRFQQVMNSPRGPVVRTTVTRRFDDGSVETQVFDGQEANNDQSSSSSGRSQRRRSRDNQSFNEFNAEQQRLAREQQRLAQEHLNRMGREVAKGVGRMVVTAFVNRVMSGIRSFLGRISKFFSDLRDRV